MKYMKMAGLLAALAGLMAFVGVGSASATQVDCGEELCATGTVVQTQTEATLTMHQAIGDIECKDSTIEGTVGSVGGSTETAKVGISNLVFHECNTTMVILAKGNLEFHTKESTADNNGTLTSTGTEITQEFLGFHCIFNTNNTDLGTVTGSSNTKEFATLDVLATIPRTGGRSGSFCGSTAQWTGFYRITTPAVFNVT